MRNIVLFTLGLALPAMAPAQSAPQPAARAADSAVIRTRDVFFALSVADLDASARWYQEKLGLSVIMHVPKSADTKAGVTVLRGGGLTVELVAHEDAVPLRTLEVTNADALYVHGIFKVGVAVDDFDGTIAALRARGVEIAIGPFPKRADQPANAIVRDNAGNMIQVVGR